MQRRTRHHDASIADTRAIATRARLDGEMERRALAGELAQLEEAWREAEEVAAIADHLLDEELPA